MIGPRQMTFPLTHWDGDTLAMVHVLEFTMAGDQSLARFTVGEDGLASGVQIDLHPRRR